MENKYTIEIYRFATIFNIAIPFTGRKIGTLDDVDFIGNPEYMRDIVVRDRENHQMFLGSVRYVNHLEGLVKTGVSGCSKELYEQLQSIEATVAQSAFNALFWEKATPFEHTNHQHH